MFLSVRNQLLITDLINGELNVSVYRNLNNNCFSIKDRKSCLVVAHGDGFVIKNAVMKVGKGRLRVLKNKQKNVHAYINGEFSGNLDLEVGLLDEIYYNPYSLDCFINNRTKEKIVKCKSVYFKNGKCYILED